MTADLIQPTSITYAPLVFTERAKASDTSLTFEQHIQNLQANAASLIEITNQAVSGEQGGDSGEGGDDFAVDAGDGNDEIVAGDRAWIDGGDGKDSIHGFSNPGCWAKARLCSGPM